MDDRKEITKSSAAPENSKHILNLTFYFWFDITVNIICAVGVDNIFKLSYLHEKSFYFLDMSLKLFYMSPFLIMQSSMFKCTIASSFMSLLLSLVRNILSYFSIILWNR